MEQFHQQKFKRLMRQVKKHMASYAMCGLTLDGMRQCRIGLGINQRTPKQQRYQRYIRLIGQVQDMKKMAQQRYQQWIQLQYDQLQEEDDEDSEPSDVDQG